jgi:sugar O-acyltransferase (sialic acid O-acetyltransferase NeuD family)
VRDPVVIWGCGGQGRELSALCQEIGLEVAGFLDERPEMKGRVVDDVPVLGDLGDITVLRDRVAIVCAGVGDPQLKRRFCEKTTAGGFRLAEPLVHPGVAMSRRCTLGPGAVVCAGCTLTINVTIGAHALLNLNCTVAHDSRVGDFATLCAGVHVSGNVIIGDGVFVGAGAVLRERTSVGAWSVVGANAFVRADVPAGVLVVGVPATVKRQIR